MNNSRISIDEKLRIDREIEEMKKHPIDYSDIPEIKDGTKGHWVWKEFLDKLPPDILREMARRRLKQLQDAGYEIPDELMASVETPPA